MFHTKETYNLRRKIYNECKEKYLSAKEIAERINVPNNNLTIITASKVARLIRDCNNEQPGNPSFDIIHTKKLNKYKAL